MEVKAAGRREALEVMYGTLAAGSLGGEVVGFLNSKFALNGLESVSNMEGAGAGVKGVVGTTQHLTWVVRWRKTSQFQKGSEHYTYFIFERRFGKHVQHSAHSRQSKR